MNGGSIITTVVLQIGPKKKTKLQLSVGSEAEAGISVHGVGDDDAASRGVKDAYTRMD
jgi:hypothetical protein